MFSISTNSAILAKAFRISAGKTTELAQKSLLKAGYKIEELSKRYAPVDTGRLRSSIHTTSQPLKVIVQPSVKYGLYVHEGTRPHFVSVSKISDWAKRHGANPFLVAKGISRKGTKAQPFMADAVDDSKTFINGIYQNFIDDIVLNIVKNNK